MKTAFFGEYTTFEWSPDEMRMDRLVKSVPVIVFGRRVAILSFDSGRYRPTPQELSSGWREVDGVAYSPHIIETEMLPYDCFDEWYVVENDAIIREAEPYVNFVGFSPIDFGWLEKLEAFRLQVERIRPLSVLAEGSFCYLVTRDQNVIQKIK